MENNILIAEFMNLEKFGFKNKNYLVLGKHLSPIQLPYKTSWDWLMPVVVRLFDDEYNEFDGADDLSFRLNDTLLETNLDSLYNIVVEFINEYNKTI